ncbi:MAG: CinA family protein [Hyphomicrobiales bacterium]|nr:CinA family protein [Hyphomicrobiales bacterium]
MAFDAELEARAKKLVALLTEKGLKLATAESCTGGLVAGLITEIAGSSAMLDRGFVVYSNEAKTGMLGVAPHTLGAHGAVSEATARELAEGALERSLADIAVSITGIAGPGGGSAEKPVGLVHFACARRGRQTAHVERRFGDLGRAGVRRAAIVQALEMVEAAVR